MERHSVSAAPSQDSEPSTPVSVAKMTLRDRNKMDDPDGTVSNIAHCIEILRKNNTALLEKENSLKQLLDILNTKPDAYSAIGSDHQAVPILVTLLRSGSTGVKTHAATVLGYLCQEEELRVKVLLGGCVPPLLGLLRSGSKEGQLAAAKTINAVSQGGIKDNLGSKIFSTEGVVPMLWEQLKAGRVLEKQVDALLTGALRNLCANTDGFWPVTIAAGGVGILVKLLKRGNSACQSNACFLLACMMSAEESVCSEVLQAGAVEQLLGLLEPGNEVSVRAGAAGSLKALSASSKEARRQISTPKGVACLMNATIAPSKEFMQGEYAQALQENAMSAMANVSGGLAKVISGLCGTLQSKQKDTDIADQMGAIASALMIYDMNAECTKPADPVLIEQVLINQFKTHLSFIVQERIIEALASLYSNIYLSKKLKCAEAKRILIGLITMASPEVQEELIDALRKLCNDTDSLWHAFQGKEGIQLLISLLGISSEQQQECSVALLCMLSNENDDCKWSITAAGGIPPLVQILEIGSSKAKEDSATILGNLCNHSEDIRACVERADAVPNLLWLLKNGSSTGKEIAAKTLNHLIHKSDSSTMSQLTALLTSDLPESKVHVLEALKSLLSIAPLNEVLFVGSAANDAISTMIKILGSTNENTVAKSASALASLFEVRKDIRESSISFQSIGHIKKLLESESVQVKVSATCCLAAIFRSIKNSRDINNIAEETFQDIVLFAKSPIIEIAEQGVRALANLFLNTEFASMVPENVIIPITRVLKEGTIDGKTHAAAAIARLLQARNVDESLCAAIQSSGSVIALVNLLASVDVKDEATSETLDALASLIRTKEDIHGSQPPLAVLAQAPQCLGPLVSCLVTGTASLQEKTIEVLSKLCREQPIMLGDMISRTTGCIAAIANQVINSDSNEVKAGGAALLICAAQEHRQKSIEALNESNLCIDLIQSLVEMLQSDTASGGSNISCQERDYDALEILKRTEGDYNSENCTAAMLGGRVAVWLLCIMAVHDSKSKFFIMEAGAIEVLTDRVSEFTSQAIQVDPEENQSTWVCALLLAILFQDREIIRGTGTMRAIPALAGLLKSENTANRYFAAQAIASLVCNGSRGTLLAVANSGTASGLIQLLGCAEGDIENYMSYAEAFSLPSNPEQVALERLFRVDDIRFGATSRKTIPALVDLIKPIQDRPGAPYLAIQLLTKLVIDNDSNKLVMAEAGALDAITKYLSLGTQDAIEEEITELLRILFSSPELCQHESAVGVVNQLVAVLRLGTKVSRFNAARALEGLFATDSIRVGETARQAVQPLVELLKSGLENEQRAAISALIRLLFENPSRAIAVIDVESNAVEVLCQILSSDSSVELKEDAADLCSVLFGNTRIRTTIAATRCVEPLVSLINLEMSPAHYAAVHALEKLLDDEQLAELIAAHGAVVPLVGLLYGGNFHLHEAVIRCLTKLGKDRPLCKLDMVKAGVMESILEILQEAPDSLCAAMTELLRILTNNNNIAKSASAARLVDPLFFTLSRPELGPAGQHSTMQVLVNILEDPDRRASCKLTPAQSVEPLIPLLMSPSQAVQQLVAELLSHLFLEENLQRDSIAEQAIGPLVQVLGSGVPVLQQKAIKALISISVCWPNAVAELGGVNELSKVVLQSEPPLPHALWESAASVLSTILQFSSQYYLEVPVAALVRMLRSGSETTLIGALNALLVLQSDDSSSDEAMAESGAIEALLELLKCHQCEEAAARLLESLLNNVKIREMKVARSAISPLSQYLLDPQTQIQQSKMLVALALGDLFQKEALARTTDAVSACRALVNLLEDQPTEEIKVVTICALQNLVMYSRANKRAVAEAGGIQVILDLLGSSDPDTAIQAATFFKYLFSNHTIQEYASSDIVRALSVSIEKELWASGTVNEEYLKALNALLGNFPRLRPTEPATLCISHLVAALKSGPEATQEAALDSLFLLRQAWSSSPLEVGKAQAVAAAEAIPILQYLIQSGPPRFQEKTELLLQCLPGTLLVTIKRGVNLKQSVGNPSAYCKLTLGNGPPRQTKIVTSGTNPEWDEVFAWAFDNPPKGQKLHISCKNKSTFGKSTFGKVTIQIDRVVMLGSISGEYTLQPEKNKSGQSRSLEIEFQWTNK